MVIVVDISINNYTDLTLDSSCKPTQGPKQETPPALTLPIREQLSSSNVERVGGKLNNSHLLNHSSRNSAFRPVSGKQKGEIMIAIQSGTYFVFLC